VLSSSAAEHYQWQFNGVDLPTDTSQSIFIANNGTYSIVVSNDYGCNASTSIGIIKTDISTLSKESKIYLYPNPATQSCTIFVPDYNGEKFIASLVNMIGQDIGSPMNFEANSFTFPVSQYAKGVYMLRIADSENHQAIKKLVIE
jgi:hypothetical protein